MAAADGRIQWTLNRMSCLLGTRAEKMDKFHAGFNADEKSKQNLAQFFETAEKALIFFYPNGDSISCNCNEFPGAAEWKKKKVIVMHRVRPEIDITPATIAESVVIVELFKNVVDLLHLYCNAVYLSMLMNPSNQKGWSDLVSKDLMEKYHQFLAYLSVTAGHMKGITYLPLPHKDSFNGSNVAAKDKAHVYETCLVHWTKQIKHVLKMEPESALKSGNPHLGPDVELNFWIRKSENLNYICSQLEGSNIRGVLKFLEQNKSTYTGPFSKLQKEVKHFREEANDNVRFLQTLKEPIKKLMADGVNFEELDKEFGPIMHGILLIWTHSRYYNTPSRLVVLIRLICNTIINQAMTHMPGAEIFNMIADEAQECHDKLTKTIGVCEAFKDTFFGYKSIAQPEWKLTTAALFLRLDNFLERLQDARNFTQTVIQFKKLERVEIGGTRGTVLSDNVKKIEDEFKAAVETFKQVPYDILEIEEKRFDDDFLAFLKSVKDLDRRLARVLGLAYYDLDTMAMRMKLIDNFEGLLERSILQDDLESKFVHLLETYKADLKTVFSLFNEHRDKVNACAPDAPIFSNLPPIAGSIYWCRTARDRVKEPMEKLQTYSAMMAKGYITDREEYKDVMKLYSSLLKLLREYEEQRYTQWENESVRPASDKLKMRLLRRNDKSGLLKVNFDPALVRLLREVKFFLLFNLEPPPAALDLYYKSDRYRQWVGQLEHIVYLYNAVLTDLLPVEEPLLADRIDKMDLALSPGLTDLPWNKEDDIPPFIETTMKVVSDVSNIVSVMKDNLRGITTILASWCKEPIVERKVKGAKPVSLEEFEAKHNDRVGGISMNMTDGGKLIHKYLKDSSEALKCSKVHPTWKAYQDFVSNIVIEGFVFSVSVSLQALYEILHPDYIKAQEVLPLFDVKLELLEDHIVFDPPFRSKNPSHASLRRTIDKCLQNFFTTVTIMPRLDLPSGDYLSEVKEHFNTQILLAQVSKLVDDTETRCLEYCVQFERHSFLWKDDRPKCFENFLNDDAHDIVEGYKSEDDMTFKDIMSRIDVDIGRPIPKLDKFLERIEFFRSMMGELSNLRTPECIDWVRVNAGPVRIALVTFAKRWEETYTSFLRQYTEDRIHALNDYIDRLQVGLGPPSPADPGNEENADLLFETMKHISNWKISVDAVKEMFAPLGDMRQVLKKLAIPFDGAELLDQAPANWVKVEQMAHQERELTMNMRLAESVKIRSKVWDFLEDEVKNFRRAFNDNCPFSAANAERAYVEQKPGECEIYDLSYATIDRYFVETEEMRKRAKVFNDRELLFDMQQTSFMDLQVCFNDVVLLKGLWDGIVLVSETFKSWDEILWKDLKTDELVQTCRELGQQVKTMDKRIRGWGAYKWLDQQVKNMMTVLPLVNDLNSPSMCDRHWFQLSSITKQEFEKGPEFKFKDLLQLKLHNFYEEVSELVAQSDKEAKIEKKLNDIRKEWSKKIIEIELPAGENASCPLLGDLGEILERLDADSLEMMNITSQGRFIEFCKGLVDEWSGKLYAIDGALSVWQTVQADWLRLEPIFMQSDDIKTQLPEETKVFEKCDGAFKDLMMDAYNMENKTVVLVCCAEGREQALTEISNEINRCEKSLNEYLEQKKKAFPRFYFVANQALLDILSNGNKPIKVATYLGDMFDGVQTLDFSKAPETGHIARGHIAKDGEVVNWVQDMELTGAVENYLATLEGHFRLMLREQLAEGYKTTEHWDTATAEKDADADGGLRREFWLDGYCAQLALVVTQIIWTEETMKAFDDLDSGNDNAMKISKTICDDRINNLIFRIQTDLKKETRNKIITIITIDVHSRDIVELFVNQKISDSTDFKWLSQLRFHWAHLPQGLGGPPLVSYTPDDLKTCVIKICDWVTIYCYEYVGNCGRLVITPLTDRCYITLTQALNLILGGAPAGPAGTGKTETTKDLSRAIGLQIVVFNCSDQMTYQTMAQIFMGIAQTGCWGCFDEFNRISIEVLSVVSTQYKTILDGIRMQQPMFTFMDEEIRLINTNGAFITMNPGYAGRTELPENLKALFRSVAMIVPDLRFICENMLMSEGFIKARPLANKFVQLYSLCKELLSKQMHYDWGLRAVKSLLRQAGALKRHEPDADENIVLCRALRDFNTPKITTLDMPIFLRLIMDLFPKIDPLPFEDPDFEKVVLAESKRRGLQPDHAFITKTVGMLRILEVRHCMFIIGPTGCGKTEVWKTLMDSLKARGEDGMWEQANPKGVTSDELYGTMSKTKEWKDGLVAVIMRNMSKEQGMYKPSHKWKWVILDGDIDATWIESMNTVMDDNKVLTLVSNERIPFSPTMRMILEIQDMKHASPATVSRGGVLFINETDIGWKPYMESWREKLGQVPQSSFYLLFTKMFEANIDSIRRSFKFSSTLLDMMLVQSITCFVDALLQEHTQGALKEMVKDKNIDAEKICYESFFAFAFMWTLGGAVADDKTTNYRKNWNGYMRSLPLQKKLPDDGEVFDYLFDPNTQSWVSWDSHVVEYEPVVERMYQNIVISNMEIERLKYILGLHMKRKKPVLYVGVAGTGKTTIVKDYLADLKASTEEYVSMAINNNNYTTSYALQAIVMSCVIKRVSRTYGPAGNKKCIYFIDDLNMPYVDTYDTQSAIMLLTQILSYGEVYNREALEDKLTLVDILFCACMNPKAGSFQVNLRLQRHFTVLTTFMPSDSLIKSIYGTILDWHLKKFNTPIQRLLEPIVQSTIDTLIGSGGITNTACFLPSASKFHYQFNLKDVANIFQGLLNTNPVVFKDGGALKFSRVWLHEMYRVFGDRLINSSDQAELTAILEKTTDKQFGNKIPKEDLYAEPLIMTSFVSKEQGNDPNYLPVKDLSTLKKVVEDKLQEHNEVLPTMELVMFSDALCHVCRICRITNNACGHALLVGVGGSGKQSLARLACFINEHQILRILVNQQYNCEALRLNLQEFYEKAAGKSATPSAFMMTDGQIADERFLVYINDMLSSANIPDLFTREEYDAQFANIRAPAKAAGVPDDREALFMFFLDRVKKYLHYILCHSPVGDDFRIRGRKFPAIISCMVIDEFMPWPRDALEGVAQKELGILHKNGNIGEVETLNAVCGNMSDLHLSIDTANKRFLNEERRHNYTTPKSFLELTEFYKKMLRIEQKKVDDNSSRLITGLDIMSQVQESVDGLKKELAVQQIAVANQKADAAAIMEEVSTAQAGARVEEEKAATQAAKSAEAEKEATVIQAKCKAELAEAMPAMEAAKEAVDCLDKPSITTLKSYTNPPSGCDLVALAASILLKEGKKINWAGAQKMMKDPEGFIQEVKAYSGEVIPEAHLKEVDKIIATDGFTVDDMMKKSAAAGNLCGWIINIVKFHRIFVKVKPLKESADAAQEALELAQAEYNVVMTTLKGIQDEVARLVAKQEMAESEVRRVERMEEEGKQKLNTANRLVVGLADEYTRWTHTVRELKALNAKLIGDCLLASAFVGYISPFSMRIRQDLWAEQWVPKINEDQIPISPGIDPLKVLCSEADIAGWQNEGLPSDRVSIENAAVVTSCDRWPLMIDPQLQGVKWIKQRVGEDLTTLQLTMNKWLQQVIMCIHNGSQLLIEAVGQEIDAILEPVLARAIIRSRSGDTIIIAGNEEEYDRKFKMYLQSKLPNPHYRPELAAQCTIINFIVTPSGLEDQILAMVVDKEKPELEDQKQALVRSQNEFKVQLAELEDELLTQLAAADPTTILDNIALINGLEVTKKTSNEISVQVEAATIKEKEINVAREQYRPVAAEGSMVFFIIILLCHIEHMYQYSLDSFVRFLEKAIERTEQTEIISLRAERLIGMIRMTIFRWVNRGLFESHKLIFCSLLTFKLMMLGRTEEKFDGSQFNYFLRGPFAVGAQSPAACKDWLPDVNWGKTVKLAELSGFEPLTTDIEQRANAFKDWFNENAAEQAKLPGDWKNVVAQNPFKKLLILRALRPDRLTGALGEWIRSTLPNGSQFTECDGSSAFVEVLTDSFRESTTITPIFFILSPGADPVKEVEAMGKDLIQLKPNVNYHNVAMGQGQDVVAEERLDRGHASGHWVMLQNIHLMPRWCVELEKRLDQFAIASSHPSFRVFLSADPSNGIPIGILERSIKLTNEPPQGMLANLKRSFALFSKEEFEERDSKVKAILFGLCHFHSLMLERKKFGPMGYNMKYPFSAGDIRDSAQVLYNYLEGLTASKIPWDDLRYIFGEIMYGGHIVDDWDRRMCSKYLLYFMRDEILEELEMIPYADDKLKWAAPGAQGNHDAYLKHIDTMPAESPLFFGMHPNAEINFRTTQCNTTCAVLLSLMGGGGTEGGEEGEGTSPMQLAEQMCGDILEEISEKYFPTTDISGDLSEEEKGPYQYVFLQECDAMNGLVFEMKRGLQELQLGFRGELTMSEQMEDIADALFKESLPMWWVKLGFPSTRPLRSWRVNLLDRCVQLDEWVSDTRTIPKATDVARLFNPQSFLTAIKQLCCQIQKLELDKLTVITDVTKFDQVEACAKDGAYVTGMYLEGARWDAAARCLEDSKPKEMYTPMPIVHCTARLATDKVEKNIYICPTYCVPIRRPWFVFAAQLRTRAPSDKWVLGGVAMILDIGQ